VPPQIPRDGWKDCEYNDKPLACVDEQLPGGLKIRWKDGQSNELLLSNTQDQLINSLINRLTATVNVNITYAQLLRELLPVSQDPNRAITPNLQLGSKSAAN
jgi:hypothetical protein